MAERKVEAILDRLNAEGTQVLNLLNDYRGTEYQPLWQQDPRLYRAFARKLSPNYIRRPRWRSPPSV